MANHKSALKRARQSQVRRLRNKAVKTRVKSAIKTVRQAAAENNTENIESNFKDAQSIIDNATKKGILHPRTAARKISRLARVARSVQS